MNNKLTRVALGSFFSRTIKLVLSPLILLVISTKLSSDQLAFYYTFMTLLSFQGLLELGVGHVIKQYISHSYINDRWDENSKFEIKEYFYFSLFWFSIVSIFLVSVIGTSGFYYLCSSKSEIDWEIPWILFITVSSLNTLTIPLRILLDGTQKQEIIIRSDVISGIISAIALCICLHLDLGLYSISISSLLSTIIMLIIIRNESINVISSIKEEKKEVKLIDVYHRIKKLFKGVSIVFICSIPFLHSMNMISFLMLDISYAGKIMFCIALARSGYHVSESIVKGQSTILANMISKGDAKKSLKVFNKYLNLSLIILITGYFLFLISSIVFPSFVVFKNLPSVYVSSQIFLYHFIVLYKSLKNDYIRNYKVEPFVKLAIFESVAIPLSFLLGIYVLDDSLFIPSIVVIFISIIWTKSFEKKFYSRMFSN